uniref:Reelin domain-containing protein n=1 Tax=Graphocephala atropunctata TaxID=36148 RepID=A0A1B6MDH3_9HEMI
MTFTLTSVALWCALVQTALSRPDGLPWPDSCESLSPGNNVPPQTGPMPFELSIDDNKITWDGCIYITIKGEKPNEFAGFMVQARDNSTGAAVGYFREADDVKLMDCFGKVENTAININYLLKDEVIIRWLPDNGYTGIVHMYATIAKDYMEQVYWLKQKTRPVKVIRSRDVFDK